MAEDRKGFEFLDKEFVPTNLDEALARQRDIWQKKLVESLYNVKRVSSGALAQSINVEITESDNVFAFTLLMEDYWQWVDEGREKGGKQPPEEAMLQFIALRGIQPKAPATKKPRKKAIPQNKLRKSLAFAMSRSIKEKGIKPTNFYSDEIEGLIEGFRKDITDGLSGDIELTFSS